MHADSKSLGEASTRQAEEERLRLQREWLDAKAALAKERERAAEASRDAELHAAALQQKVHDALADGASAREEKAQLQSQADTLRQLQEAQQLQLRDAIAKLAAAPASGGGGALASSPGGSTDNVAEELARAKRELQVAQEAVAAEKEHGAQYRRIAEGAEKERDEQLRLSAQFKASTEAKLAEAEAARAAADERLQGARGGESAIREEATTLRTQLAEARRAADEATERARQAAKACRYPPRGARGCGPGLGSRQT